MLIQYISNIQCYACFDNKLLQAMTSNRLTANNILCSNLVHFAHFVNVLEKTKNVHEVDVPVKSYEFQNPLVRIDIVADNGGTWIKVIARNSKSLNETALGRSNYGLKSILDHASSYTLAASYNLYLFRRPKVRIF